MEEEYWNRFKNSGQVSDYLYYKGLGICRQVMERCEAGECRGNSLMNVTKTGGKIGESDYGYRNGAASSTDR